MMTSLRKELLQRLVELGNFYPELRFGQLVCMATSMAGENSPGFIEEVEDEAVLEAAGKNLARRARHLAREIDGSTSTWSPVRVALLGAIRELSDQHPEWALGKLIFRLAALAHVNVYDIEDEQLLQAARSNSPGLQWFTWYTDKLEHASTFCERRDELSYRCPCCYHRTLYERGGFEICPVCYWEDDGQDDVDADTVRGGPNGDLSLAQARENYTKYGVCDPKFAEHIRPPRLAEV